MSQIENLRLIMIISSAVGVLICLWFAKRHRLSWLFIVAPVTLLIHIIIFYISVFITGMTAGEDLFVNWAAAIRLQSIITIILMILHADMEFTLHGQ
jgi:hypothetical protein